MEHAELLGLALVGVLCATHLVSPLLRFVEAVPRSAALSAAGGISVAYVFVHLLPEIARAQVAVDETGVLDALHRHVWVVALVGLAIFYGLERWALCSRAPAHADRDDEGEATSPAAFWVSMASFSTYNAIIGYLVVRHTGEDGVLAGLLFAVALGVHFVVNDAGLRKHHRRRYDHAGRPILVAALLAGWATAVAADLPEVAIGVAVAFVGGGVVLNVMKEELPEERESRFGPFAAGAAAYALLLLAL